MKLPQPISAQHNNAPQPPPLSIPKLESHRRLPSFSSVLHICDSKTLSITKPNAVVTSAPGLLGPIRCGDLNRLALSFSFDWNLCNMLLHFGVSEICACPSTQAPSSPPTIRPLYTICHIDVATILLFLSQPPPTNIVYALPPFRFLHRKTLRLIIQLAVFFCNNKACKVCCLPPYANI